MKLVPIPLGLAVSESGDDENFLHFPVSRIISLSHALEVDPTTHRRDPITVTDHPKLEARVSSIDDLVIRN